MIGHRAQRFVGQVDAQAGGAVAYSVAPHQSMRDVDDSVHAEVFRLDRLVGGRILQHRVGMYAGFVMEGDSAVDRRIEGNVDADLGRDDPLDLRQ